MYHTAIASPLEDGKWLIEIFSPVKNSLGNIIGVVSVMVDWHSFIDKELDLIKFGNTGHPFIVDSDRLVIADPILSTFALSVINLFIPDMLVFIAYFIKGSFIIFKLLLI